MKSISVVRIATMLAFLPSLASAQVFRVGDREEQDIGPRRSPVFGGASLIYGKPSGSFADYVEQGFGFDQGLRSCALSAK